MIVDKCKHLWKLQTPSVQDSGASIFLCQKCGISMRSSDVLQLETSQNSRRFDITLIILSICTIIISIVSIYYSSKQFNLQNRAVIVFGQINILDTKNDKIKYGFELSNIGQLPAKIEKIDFNCIDIKDQIKTPIRSSSTTTQVVGTGNNVVQTFEIGQPINKIKDSICDIEITYNSIGINNKSITKYKIGFDEEKFRPLFINADIVSQ